jgi:HAD superfamily hydrolase (TIGR01509 family)
LVEAVIFDLDGTLIRSKVDYGEMRRRVLRILAEAGAPEDRLSSQMRIWEILMAGEGLLRELGVADDAWRRVVERVNLELNEVELAALDTVESTPYAHEALRGLRDLGVMIGVATRSCRAYAIRSLELAGLSGYVDLVLARDDVEHPKPDPRHLLKVLEALGSSPEMAVYVGDTTTDLKTAEGAGIPFIGFVGSEEWGRRLREEGCAILIDDLRRIIDIIEGGFEACRRGIRGPSSS